MSAREALALVERELECPEILATQRNGLDRAAVYLRRTIDLEQGRAVGGPDPEG